MELFQTLNNTPTTSMNRKVALFLVALLCCAGAVMAQKTFTGTVYDSESRETMPGVRVSVVGTPSKGTITNADGKFSIKLSGKGTLKFNFLGYADFEIPFSQKGSADLGNIYLTPDSQKLDELVVVGKGVIDLASNRLTPVASTIVSSIDIQTKGIGNVEFPEVMKNTPNVYVSNQTGGYGDSKMFLRGFDQSNTAFLLNGQPINGMEDGNMYWSNWAGIADIANAIDVQRGLGSSKLAISSVGGTVNIVTKATDLNRGGFVRFMGGYGNFYKGTVAYNTGLMSNGWGVSVLLDAWYGQRKWNDGTQGAGQNYFVSIGKKAGDHLFNFLIFGAPQWHNQNFSVPQEMYDKYGYKYNKNWGWYEGKVLNERKNYYHKPVMNFNWDWAINDKHSLSTVLYASFGRGGGTGSYGNGPDYIKKDKVAVGRDTDGQIAWDYIAKEYNASISGGYGAGYNGTAIRSSANNHQWYGLVTNYSYDDKKNWSFNAGADFRFYRGDHFRQLVNLLGLKGWNDAKGRYKGMLDKDGKYLVSQTYKADPWSALFNHADKNTAIGYNNGEWINYQGVFGQGEYHNKRFSVFAQGALSNQTYQKSDDFKTAGEKSEVFNRLGFNVKGGGSVSFGSKLNHKVFVNAGYYSRQPFLDSMFEYGNITPRKQAVENEKIFGVEAGYTVKLPGYTTVNLNAYYTSWSNRFISFGAQDYTTPNTKQLLQNAGFRLYNVAQVHKGMELEVKSQPTDNWMFRGHFTYGDWRYSGTTPVDIIDEQQGNAVADKMEVTLSGTKLGGAPQTTLGFGTEYRLGGFKVYADYNQYFNLYGMVNITDVAKASVEGKTYQSEKLNNYGLIDMGAQYRWAFTGRQALLFRANVYNFLNSRYIFSKDNYGIYYGSGLTFNASVTYQF